MDKKRICCVQFKNHFFKTPRCTDRVLKVAAVTNDRHIIVFTDSSLREEKCFIASDCGGAGVL